MGLYGLGNPLFYLQEFILIGMRMNYYGNVLNECSVVL